VGQADFEFFEVCKVFSGPGATSATANFTYTVDIGSTGVVDFTDTFSLNDGDCRDIWINGGQNTTSDRDLVTVTETGPGGAIVSHQAYYESVLGPTWSGPLTSGAQFADWNNALQGITVYFYNEFPTTTGGEGCTPGYWRQPQHWDSWEGYTPTDLFGAYFNLPGGFVNPEKNLDPATLDLLGAVTIRGGKINALTRHAVAALLNAASSGVSYDLTQAEVIALYNQAVASGDWKGPLATLVAFNEQFCPLN